MPIVTVFVQTVLKLFDLGREKHDLLLEGRKQSKHRVRSLVINCLELVACQQNGKDEGNQHRVSSQKKG